MGKKTVIVSSKMNNNKSHEEIQHEKASMLNQRNARYFKFINEIPVGANAIELTFDKSRANTNNESRIENPIVITSLIAGLAGITITIIIILSIYILKKEVKNRAANQRSTTSHSHSANQKPQNIQIEINDSTITANTNATLGFTDKIFGKSLKVKKLQTESKTHKLDSTNQKSGNENGESPIVNSLINPRFVPQISSQHQLTTITVVKIPKETSV